MRLKQIAIALAMTGAVLLGGCLPDADVASSNMTTAAKMFELERKIVAINGITDKYLFQVQGFCNIENNGVRLEILCKDGPNQYSKNFVGLSDNVTYVVEQIGGADVSVYHHRIVWKPQSVLPDIDLRGDAKELNKDRY